MKIKKRNSGITLIATIVTILILIILSGTVIMILKGDNGILTQANEIKCTNEISSFDEIIKLASMSVMIDIQANNISNEHYIATTENNLKDLVDDVAKELDVKAISIEANKKSSIPETINTEGYTVGYYLNSPEDEIGYILIWYTNNSLRSTINIENVDSKYGIKNIASDGHKTSNEVALVSGIRVKSNTSEMLKTCLTSITDGNIDLKRTENSVGKIIEDSSNIDNKDNGIKLKLSNGNTIKIDENNIDTYIGKEINDYKKSGSSEKITVGSKDYYVSTTYRLYYIDFENKYHDGKGTIYLKADYVPYQYVAQSDGNIETSKIKNLNPSLFSEGVEAPNMNSTKMKFATWLLDTEKWSVLLNTGKNTELSKYIKYIVGAPSLELLIDSYNEHYGLKGNLEENSTLNPTRPKLFYTYPNNKNGYLVAPNGANSEPYGNYTKKNTVAVDENIGNMYYPGHKDYAYYIASPSCNNNYSVMRVLGNEGGFISYAQGTTSKNCFCPIIAVSPEYLLNLKE